MKCYHKYTVNITFATGTDATETHHLIITVYPSFRCLITGVC